VTDVATENFSVASGVATFSVASGIAIEIFSVASKVATESIIAIYFYLQVGLQLQFNPSAGEVVTR
jgi:hypothetical protein